MARFWLSFLFLSFGTSVASVYYSGNATWYKPGNDYTACGKIYPSDAQIAAISASFWGSLLPQDPNINDDPMCNKTISVVDSSGNASYAVTFPVTDKCGGCAEGDLDLSSAAFQRFRDLGAGRFPVNWTFIE